MTKTTPSSRRMAYAAILFFVSLIFESVSSSSSPVVTVETQNFNHHQKKLKFKADDDDKIDKDILKSSRGNNQSSEIPGNLLFSAKEEEHQTETASSLPIDDLLDDTSATNQNAANDYDSSATHEKMIASPSLGSAKIKNHLLLAEEQQVSFGDVKRDSTFLVDDDVVQKSSKKTTVVTSSVAGEHQTETASSLPIDDLLDDISATNQNAANNYDSSATHEKMIAFASLGAPYELASAGNSFVSIPNPRSLALHNGWVGYDHTYGSTPTVWVNDGVCIVNGLIKGNHWGVLATLPAECRPKGRQIFNLNNHQYTSRVDVLPNGEIHWVTGGASHSWLSLTGITFTTTNGPTTQLSYVNGYARYNNEYEMPYYSKINGECVLGGLIGGGNGNNDVAVLPESCRPKQSLIFNVNNHQCTQRLTIRPNGMITRESNVCHQWVSLGGVTFPANEQTKNDFVPFLVNGWRGYGHEWGNPYFSLIDGECIVQGLISGSHWGHLATLPETCRPMQRLIFNLNNHQYTSRVDVLQNGQIHWIAGGQSHNWLSLTGIKFAARPSHAVVLSDYWQPYGWDYGLTTYTVQDNVCEVQGLIRGNHWGVLATLPAECRPKGRQIFNLNNHQYTSRVDVLPNGEIHWVTGGASHSWLSLTGITFTTTNGPTTQLSYVNGYARYNNEYEMPYYSKINGECVLGGLIGGGNGNNDVAVLPESCRPKQSLIFNVNNHQCTQRLTIRPNGMITRESNVCHQWVSLGGVTFPANEQTKNDFVPFLVNGWRGYGHEWGNPYFSLIDGECIVQGLISGSHWGHLATLPETCRPMQRLIFNLNNHQYTSRVDVLQNGQIHWIAGGQSHNWLSLTGIRFEMQPPPPPVVSIFNTAVQISSKEFDFAIRVRHAVCSTSSCFESQLQTDENTANGLKCEVFVKSNENSHNCDYNSAGSYLPCKKWDNFFDAKKSSDVQTSLSLVNEQGQLELGKFEIWYNCFYEKKSDGSETGLQKLHEFTVISGCSDWLPSSSEGVSIVELFLQSAPAFLELKPPECEQADRVKEAVFREFDTTPQDGRLSVDEIRGAFLRHDVDTTYLNRLIEEDYFTSRKGGVMLSDVISSSTLPLACSGKQLTESSDVFFFKSIVPNHGSKRS